MMHVLVTAMIGGAQPDSRHSRKWLFVQTLHQVCSVSRIILLLLIEMEPLQSWIVKILNIDFYDFTAVCLWWKSNRLGRGTNQMLHCFTVCAFNSIFSARNFTRVLIPHLIITVKHNSSQARQLMMLPILYFCFSTEVPFDYLSICEMPCLRNHHFGIVTTTDRCVGSCSGHSSVCVCTDDYIVKKRLKSSSCLCGLPYFKNWWRLDGFSE